MLFFALGRALLNRVSRQTRLRKNPFILLTLEVYDLNTYEHESGGTLPTERSNKLQRTCPWLILGQCSIRNVYTTDQCLAIAAFRYSCISVIWHRDLEQTFKATVKRATTTWNFFFLATLPQNVLKSDVPLFNTPVQACLKTSKGCCMLREYRLFIG